MQEIKIKIDGQNYTLNNNSDKYNRAKLNAGENAKDEQVLAHYDKLLGLIKNDRGNVKNGQFWENERQRLVNEQKYLKYKNYVNFILKEYITQIIIGLVATVIGGLILAYLL